MAPKKIGFFRTSSAMQSKRSRSAFTGHKSRSAEKQSTIATVQILDQSDLRSIRSLRSQRSEAEESTKASHQDVDLECLVGFAENISTRQSRAILNIIDEAIDELHVLVETAGARKVQVDLGYHTLEERFDTGAADETLFDLETLELYDEQYLRQSEYTKVQTDCIWLKTVLEHVTEQNDLGQCIFAIQRIISAYNQTKNDENNLLASLAKNEETLRFLKDSLTQEKVEMNREIKKRNEVIATLKDEIEDMLAEHRIKREYIVRWEDNRVETNEFVQKEKENNLDKTIRYYYNEINKETRIHNEIESFITDINEFYQREIEVWLEKYDKDIDQKDIEIQELAVKREAQKEKLEVLQAEYDRRKKAMDEYLAYKEVKKLEAEELQRKHRAATKIQAWWRGTMYRKGLGPYRKKKGKKGGKGSGKDKKGGKGSPKSKKK